MPRINDTNQGDETFPTWETKSPTTSTPKNSLSSDMRPSDMPSESIAFAEDYNTRSRKRESTTSSTKNKSRSRSRVSSAYDMPVEEKNVWAQDKEAQHKTFLKKAFEHKLVPEFLK
ncbi:hypothetical protein M409DRAFT_16633 [Zasmidium cellare ATCC 36951]|uniref:Uncharacterized protein n=1 Tax=Zasmidium cellare ATCC 36951 TaxID=1080233 RepID=A0A6A6CZY0_ZASCE|nr:uncharacterized protein M409DRAFT_16633 [Zasmidium cellare ATCC 36951]KAF2172671.1 hypothetical protein M409DRAFT_16633 [Zasmidium cellare ATCC 36951]